MIGDTAQHVGEPSLRIDGVEFRRADQGVHCSRSLTATVGTGEQPCAAPESDPALLRDKQGENSASIRMRECRRIGDQGRA
jgi:hypothetical protein